nr:PREDICTED: uncharacterized protein LOC102689962 isoform X1 [Lepisosteus oculatus]XP_015193296.1 PREDICTED: uncharacterized protein LOC102689962 isoform X1 [Lepisosteus oculatus]XP_015193298.1 PREDICTED: uncharacterized protein LOC102689962 isoform X2 [Lepisosteus oculatus]
MALSFCGWESRLDGRRLKPGQAPKRGHGYTMYHGTHKSSARAIVTSGFRPSSGGTLGPGVYCSRDISKAMGYPGSCSPGDRVVLLLRVRVGRVKKIDGHGALLQTSWHQQGYDTAWLPPSPGRCEEDCVWDPGRLAVVGVAHCADPAVKSELETLIRRQGQGQGQGQRAQCKTCGRHTEASHTVGKCWGCGESICPFMTKHVCRRGG